MVDLLTYQFKSGLSYFNNIHILTGILWVWIPAKKSLALPCFSLLWFYLFFLFWNQRKIYVYELKKITGRGTLYPIPSLWSNNRCNPFTWSLKSGCHARSNRQIQPDQMRWWTALRGYCTLLRLSLYLVEAEINELSSFRWI